VATAYLLGVSTRRVERLAEQLGVKSLSRSQVSQMATHLDAQVAAFRERPLDAGPYTFVWVDALTVKVREDGRVVNVHALVATGVNADGHREILGLDVASAEDGAGWLAFLRGLVARGLSGVALVISDAHPGLVAAIGSALPGAAWQRCRTHYLRNLLTRVPKSAQPHVATQVRTIFDQADADAVAAQYDRVVDALEAKYQQAAEHLEAARAELLAFTAYPREIWRQIWSNNPQERLNKEIRRRTDVVGIFPGRDALIRLVGAVLAEQSDEWTEGRRYMGLELLAKSRIRIVPAQPTPGRRRVEHDDRSAGRMNSTKIKQSRSHIPAPRTWPRLLTALRHQLRRPSAGGVFGLRRCRIRIPGERRVSANEFSSRRWASAGHHRQGLAAARNHAIRSVPHPRRAAAAASTLSRRGSL
jgi:putative transposase